MVVPFKDAAPFLDAAVHSVLAQNWTALDVVLVDDGGTDGSEAIARDLEGAHPRRVRVVTHEGRVNRGIGPSRALGIREARGPLVAFLDADDVWEPTHVADYVRLLRENPVADMVCGRVWAWRSWADPHLEDRLSQLAFAPGAVVAGPRLLAAVLRNGYYATTPCSLVVRRHAVLGCLEHLEAFPGMYEDQVMNSWMQLRSVAVMTGGTSAWYRQHDASFSARTSESDRAHTAFLSWLRSQVEELPDGDPEVRALVESALQEALGRATPAARRTLRASIPGVVRRGRRVLRRARTAAGQVPPAVHTERVERLLFRHGADLRGDVLVLGGESVPTGTDTTSRQTLPWPAATASSGPRQALAALPSAAFHCIVVLSDGAEVAAGDMRLRHLRRALRPSGVLLFLVPGPDDDLEQALREAFGRDAVSSDHQDHPGPRGRPLGLLRAVVPAGSPGEDARADQEGPRVP
ncbi:glycosyltransferase family 2 protein [Geodermatophilus saharensis]|uniref:glycosyltransferase family 2 protein n=1 Tax=Geodermatophilus saharensis TaxID=1137994 RepID=UPI001595201E|nr:glycosyltransferase family A protein [Geodermatophilus saharensis]